jgi:hypothetical protein
MVCSSTGVYLLQKGFDEFIIFFDNMINGNFCHNRVIMELNRRAGKAELS